MLAEGNKISINGKEYTLGARLGGGKEGSIFDVVELPKYVIKVINDNGMSKQQRNELYAHLKWLYELGKREDKKDIKQYMTVPKGLLDDKLGYVMVKAGEHDSLSKYITVPEIEGEFDVWYRERYTLKKRYQIIVNLFDALRKIHLAGLIFTDLSPNNIMVHKKENQIVFIDTDNTRKRTDSYLSVLGTPGYMAPEVYRKPDTSLAKDNKNPLYYDERTIRTFIAGFASSRLMILEGLSGTGKSSLPRAFADFMGSHTIEVPVQSSWKDRNDLLGFYNDFKKQYKETEFLKALYTATSDPNNIYVIVLDEMNLSRIEYYFADLLSVLEKPDVEDWKIELISDYASITQNQDAWPRLISEGKLQISDNTWFVGTANKDDSTFIITDI